MYIHLSRCVFLLHIMSSLRSLVKHWGLLFIFSKSIIAGISPVCYSCVVCFVWKTDLAMSAFYQQRLEWENRKVISKWIKVIEHFQFCMTFRFLSPNTLNRGLLKVKEEMKLRCLLLWLKPNKHLHLWLLFPSPCEVQLNKVQFSSDERASRGQRCQAPQGEIITYV